MLSPLWAVSSPGAKLATLPVSVAVSLRSVFRPRRVAVSGGGRNKQKGDTEAQEKSVLSINTPLDLSDEDVEADDEYEYDDEADENDDDDSSRGGLRINPPVELTVHAPEVPEEFDREYNLPDLDLLEDPEDFPYEELAKKASCLLYTSLSPRD